MMESLTPRTDEAFSKARAERGLYGMGAMTAHARQLERELAEAQRKLEVWSLRYAGLEVLNLAAMKS